MEKIQLDLNIVDDILNVRKRGDAIIVKGREGLTQLIICCPQCGAVSGSAGNHVYNRETKTYRPSIVHNLDLGGCGWHGYLTNGVFTTC